MYAVGWRDNGKTIAWGRSFNPEGKNLTERRPLEQAFDLATPHGRAMASMLAVFAAFERDMISERTRAAPCNSGRAPLAEPSDRECADKARAYPQAARCQRCPDRRHAAQ